MSTADGDSITMIRADESDERRVDFANTSVGWHWNLRKSRDQRLYLSEVLIDEEMCRNNFQFGLLKLEKISQVIKISPSRYARDVRNLVIGKVVMEVKEIISSRDEKLLISWRQFQNMQAKIRIHVVIGS